MQIDDTLISFGSAVKALDGGKVGGYLIVFSTERDPDQSANRDYFTAETDFGPHLKSQVYYHHGLDPKIGKRILGDAVLKVDEVGVWAEAQIFMRNAWEQRILALAEAGKLSWSSGTAAHLVVREQKGDAQWVAKWPLGLDASLTPTPAEGRASVTSLKALVDEEAGKAAAMTKTEGEEKFRYGAYLIGDPNDTATWKLRIEETPGNVTVQQLGAAAAALSPGGFRGNPVDCTPEERAAAEKKLRALYKKSGTEPPASLAEKKALTLEETDDQVCAALCEMVYGPQKPDMPRPEVDCSVYADTVVYRQDANAGYVLRSWALVDGKVMFGDTVTPVSQEWMPTGSQKSVVSPVEATFETHTQQVLAAVREWHTRISHIRALRELKAGRVLSAANRARMEEMCHQMESAAADMRKMLMETTPESLAAEGKALLLACRATVIGAEALVSRASAEASTWQM